MASRISTFRSTFPGRVTILPPMLQRALLARCLFAGLFQIMNLNAASPAPPVAPKVPKIIETHGDKRADDYFWLREKTNAEVLAYLEKENAYAEATTQRLAKFQDALYHEILAHLKETDTSAPV